MGLVYKVLSDKIHGQSQVWLFTREDLFQIGCIGLCKAVATDKGGAFSTYAYRLVWNEICDALVYASRKQAKEMACEILPESRNEKWETDGMPNLQLDIWQAMQEASKQAPPSTAKGIRAICLMSQGYTSREIGEKMGASDRLVCAWVSKARKFLRGRQEFREAVA